MSEKQALINFHGNEILTIRTESGIHVVMKYIVEAMGLDWSTQSSRLKKQSKKFNYGDIPIVAIDGKTRDMGGIPLRKLTGWLFSINPENIKNPTVRGTVEIFQEECFHVLHQHWFSKKSEEKKPLTLPDFTNPAEAAEAWAKEYREKENAKLLLQKAESKIEADKPKVDFASQIEESPDTISMTQMSRILSKKGYETGRDRLFNKLMELGI
ncbi:phage antirepressor KilAC domain-containing protein, partial [Candidatus Pacearchaeota archaeon]|nr:phage antirepressor KilAC domain-containing protein [Candidatus Pacearchaeota archaeon]